MAAGHPESYWRALGIAVDPYHLALIALGMLLGGACLGLGMFLWRKWQAQKQLKLELSKAQGEIADTAAVPPFPPGDIRVDQGADGLRISYKRFRWQVHFAWEAYRTALEKGETAEQPQANPEDDPLTRLAHVAEGPKPPEPYTAWVENREDLVKRNYDLSARNPNQDDRVNLPLPAKLTARLLERTREFQSNSEDLHAVVSTGGEILG